MEQCDRGVEIRLYSRRTGIRKIHFAKLLIRGSATDQAALPKTNGGNIGRSRHFAVVFAGNNQGGGDDAKKKITHFHLGKMGDGSILPGSVG